MPPVNGVGEPCAGEPHARFDAAGAGNGAPGHGHAVKQPAGETRGKVAAGPHAGQRHRASPRPYPVQRGHPPAITWEAARRGLRDSGTLSGTCLLRRSNEGGGRPRSFPAKSMAAASSDPGVGASLIRGSDRDPRWRSPAEAADAFLSSPRYANPNTRRGYTGVLDRLLAGLGASRPLAEVSGEEMAGRLAALGQRAPATWNRNRGAVAAWLSWCAASRLPAPVLPGQRRTAPRAPQRHPRGTPAGDRPGADPPRRSAAGEDPVADAVRDRRPRQRGAGAEHRRPRPGRPPRPDPLQGRRHRMDLLGLR